MGKAKWWIGGYLGVGSLILLMFVVANWPLEMTAENFRLMLASFFLWPLMVLFVIFSLIGLAQ